MRTLALGGIVLGVAVSSAAIWACTQDGQQEPAADAQRQEAAGAAAAAADEAGNDMTQQLRAGCPTLVPGAHVAVSDTQKGIAMTFTTDEGDVQDVRTRARHMAQMYEMHGGRRSMMWHHMGMMAPGRRPMGSGMGMGPGGAPMGPESQTGTGQMSAMPQVESSVTEIDDGARVSLTPADASQLEALRQQIRRHAERMRAGDCWMLQ